MNPLEKLVKDGKITQEEADQIVKDLTAKSDKKESKVDETKMKEPGADKIKEILESITDKEPKHNAMLIAEVTKKYENEMKEMKEFFGKKLDATLNLLGEQRQRSEAAEKAMNEKLEAERAAKIKTAIENAKKSGKLPPENKELEEKWTKSLMNDYETNIALLESVAPTIKNESNSGNNTVGTGGAGRPSAFGSGLNSKIYDSLVKQPDYVQIV